MARRAFAAVLFAIAGLAAAQPAVDRYPARGNPRFGLPPRSETGACDDFRDTLTGFALVGRLLHARLLLASLTCIKTWTGGTSFHCTGETRYPTGRT